MLPIDIYVEGSRIGVADWDGHTLGKKIRGGSSATREPPRPSRRCAHDEDVAEGFAYCDYWREHWPIAFCRTCYSILAGRHRRAGFTPSDSPFSMTPEEVIASKWNDEWPRAGRPRRKNPPPRESWPDGY